MGCSGCSGGEKVGYLGGTGYLTFNGVSAPRAGTYLMQLSYVDGDSSRTAVVTVNGTPFDLPLPGTNDNDWDAAADGHGPGPAAARARTPSSSATRTDYVSDIDKIAI